MTKTQLIDYSLQTARNCLRKGTKIAKKAESLPQKATEIPGDVFVRETSAELPVASRKITRLEMVDFRDYLLAKRLDLKITPEEIKNLFAYEGAEFEQKAFEFLTSKMQIPKDLIPNFYPRPEQFPIPDGKMLYDFALNNILVNPAYKSWNKKEYLASLRHELQHFMQSMTIYRHEVLGEQMLQLNLDKTVTAYMNFVVANAKTYSQAELKSMGADNTWLKIYEELKTSIQNNDKEEYEKIMLKIKQIFTEELKPQFETLKQTIVDKMGLIKANSPEGIRAKKYFECTKKEYLDQNNNIDYGKYFLDCREVEALVAGDALECNIESLGGKKRCFLEWIRTNRKQAEEQIASNDKIMSDLNRQRKEIKEQGISYKELFSYLYD